MFDVAKPIFCEGQGQFDQIGRFLKVLGSKLCNKSSPNVCDFGAILKTSRVG